MGQQRNHLKPSQRIVISIAGFLDQNRFNTGRCHTRRGTHPPYCPPDAPIAVTDVNAGKVGRMDRRITVFVFRQQSPAHLP